MADARSDRETANEAPPHAVPGERRAPAIPVAREPEVGRAAPLDEERRRAAAAVEAEEDAFCELLDAAYLRTDVHGIVRRANAAAGDLLGRPVAAIVGRPLAAFVDDARQDALRRLADGLQATSATRRAPLALHAADDAPVVVDAAVLAVRAGGAMVGARWLLRRAAGPRPPSAADVAELVARATGPLGDATDHRELLHAAARHAVPALGDWCVVDLAGDDGTFERLAVAHAAAEAEALHGAVPDARGDHPVARAARTLRAQVERDGGTAWRVPGGPPAHAWLSIPMAARGTVLGVVSFAMARSGRAFAPLAVAAAEELVRRVALAADNALLYRRAARAGEAKSAFLGAISHELRTPLTAVIGYAELLADGVAGPLAERQADFVHRIRESGDHLHRLVEELLDVARLEANEERAACEPVQVAAVAEQACALVEPQADRRGLALTHESALPAEFVLHTDPTKLRQILVNLLGNAVKFTDVGEVRLQARLDAARQQVEFTVRDTGIGIPRDLLPHVFDPFWQVEQTTTRARGGAGLGLSVVRHLARLLGGDVVAQSEPGQGSCFRVWLPAGAGRSSAAG